ncbi:MAG: GNAT family N-acetyltransferase, partial [Pseudomonadota bacterium]
EHFKAFAAALRDHYPKRLGRSMRFIPEIAPSEEVDALLKTHGFRKKTKEYQSLTVDLTQTEENLRANLRKNWHSTLKKAEKSGLSVEWDEDGLHLPWLLKFYSFDKKTKGYDGPSVELLEALSKTFTPEKGMVIARAMLNKRAVGAILIFCHGRASTYQIGWNAQEGRKHGAHNLLLWNALLYLKARGATEFDLGGVNDEDARSIKTFKEGLGANLVSLAGLYTS